MSESQTRCGFVAIIGAPNAGKSTLLNSLVGAKIAIVTPKVQTTRARMLGIALAGESQIVFIDTPGIFAPRRRLDRAMVHAAWSGAADADLVVLIVDAARGISEDVAPIVEGLRAAKRRIVLALNKIDAIKDRSRLLTLAEDLNARLAPQAVFMVSALTGDGVDDLKTWLANAVPPGPWLYPADQLSDVAQRLMAAEITREKLYLRLHQELPYAAMVETESWHAAKEGSVRIEQVIYVERDSQKGIVIGKGGRQLKAIGAAARADMEQAFGCRVHLFLHVKVDPRWSESRERYGAMGLDWTA
ncbi:MAG: GTPase Era [Alphaproteobacteria bacterium]|nr:MAG: GTPase Era [Alphaproteobacteria bacterium]